MNIETTAYAVTPTRWLYDDGGIDGWWDESQHELKLEVAADVRGGSAGTYYQPPESEEVELESVTLVGLRRMFTNEFTDGVGPSPAARMNTVHVTCRHHLVDMLGEDLVYDIETTAVQEARRWK